MGQKAGEKWTTAAKLQPTFPKSDRLLDDAARADLALRGRFALLPARDEVITPQHVRLLMDREGI